MLRLLLSLFVILHVLHILHNNIQGSGYSFSFGYDSTAQSYPQQPQQNTGAYSDMQIGYTDEHGGHAMSNNNYAQNNNLSGYTDMGQGFVQQNPNSGYEGMQQQQLYDNGTQQVSSYAHALESIY